MGLKDAKHAVIPVADNNSDLKEDTACQNYYDRADDFIWDSIYVHFDIYVFIYQFILHLFLPLSIWMSPEPRAQMLWFDRKASPNEKFTIFTLGCFNTMTLVSLVIYEFLPDSDYHHFFGAIAYPLIFNVMWKLSVAIKYAMYSPTEYQRILTFKSWESTQNYLDQTLINRNLLSEQNDHVNRFEIAAGGHRCGVNNIHTVHFQIQNPAASAEATRQLADWHDFLTATTPVLTKTSSKHQVNNTGLDTSKHGTDGDDGLHFDLHKQPNGSYKISLFDLCRHLQQYSQQEAIHEIGKIVEIPANCAIILVALIPYFSLIDGSYKVPLNSTLTIVFLAFTTFDCISFLFIIVSRFMNGAIIDYRRQFIMQRAFNDFIRLSDYDGLMNLSINHPFKTSNKKRDDISQRETMARFMDTHALEDFHTMRKKESMKRLRRTSLQGEVLLGGVKDVELGVGVEVGGMGSDEHKQTNRPVSLPPLDPFGARARHDHGHGHGRHRPSIALSAMSESQKRAWDGEEHIKDPDMRDPAAHVRSFPRICMDFERNIFSWVQVGMAFRVGSFPICPYRLRTLLHATRRPTLINDTVIATHPTTTTTPTNTSHSHCHPTHPQPTHPPTHPPRHDKLCPPSRSASAAASRPWRPSSCSLRWPWSVPASWSSTGQRTQSLRFQPRWCCRP